MWSYLRMLAAWLGRTIDEATIAQSCGMTSLGCTIQDLLAGAQVLAFQAKLLRISSERTAVAALSNSAPFVAMIDLSGLVRSLAPFQWHFIVALELANDVVSYHDPADGPEQRRP
jgi:ABC-type bacteriocin/lantibiotic exporter with double-glycine peptidase domain